MKRKVYPVYKESGIEWLGEIPSHWCVKPMKYITDFYTGWTPSTNHDEYFNGENLWANISDLGPKLLMDTENRISDNAVYDSQIKSSPKGSLLFSFKLSIGKVSVVGSEMYTNEAIATFIPCKNIVSNFLYWAAPIYITKNANENIYGAQLLNQELIKNARIVAPDLGEQQAIASFLDRETERIDNLISKKQQQIELLQEKRSALISHVVTKGIDPNVKMKDSGVEWLGEIPENWATIRLKYLTLKIGSGKTPHGGSQIYADSGIVFLRSQNIYDDGIRLEDVAYIDSEIDQEMNNTRVMPNDLLLNITGASIGRTSIVPCNFPQANVNQHVCIIRLQNNIEPRFIAYYLKSCGIKYQINSLQVGSSREGLNFDEVGNLIISLPDSLVVQERVANFLDLETKKLDSLISKIELSIKSLNEYRTALISAAVTGKIDVRQEDTFE